MPHRAEIRPYYGQHWRKVVRPLILARANGCCERCHRPASLLPRYQVLEVAHLVVQPPAEGHDEADNLAALCSRCHKTIDYAAWTQACYATRAARKDKGRPLLEDICELSKLS